MQSEEDKQRIEEAKSCNDCLSWHRYCKAECCSIIFIKTNPKELDKRRKTILVRMPLTTNYQRYYNLRGVKYVHGTLMFRKDRITVIGGKVMYIYPCSRLDGYLCKDHPENKPKVCKLLTIETAHLPDQPFNISDNCLFKYKNNEGVNVNGESKEE